MNMRNTESICRKEVSPWWGCHIAAWLDYRDALKPTLGGFYMCPDVRIVFEIANNISHYRHSLIREIIIGLEINLQVIL